MSKTSRGYTTQEILALLDVRAHILRYWVENIALLAPSYDDSGRRRWTGAQARLLLRLRHLIVERGMSVAGAQRTLVEEASNPVGTRKAQLERLRDQLLGLRDTMRTADSDTVDTALSGDPAPDGPVADNPGRVRISDRVAAAGTLRRDCASLIIAPGDAEALRETDRLIGDFPAIIAVSGDDGVVRSIVGARTERFVLSLAGSNGGVTDLVHALVASGDLDRWLTGSVVDTLLYWRPGADEPLPPVPLLRERALERESGLAVAVCGDTGRIDAVAFARRKLAALHRALARADTLSGGSPSGITSLLTVEPRIVLRENCPDR